MITGDLVFSLIGNNDNAISAVTKGYKGARVNHVGIVVKNTRGTFVLEAFPPEVRLTHINVHLRRSKDNEGKQRYMLGRLKHGYCHLIENAINYGLQKRNVPYDMLYLTDEKSIYCSELIVDMFKHSNNGNEFFPKAPMNFKNLETGEYHPHWIEYYEYFGIDVPQGTLGSNAGDLSRDSKIEIYSVEGNIAGYEGN